AEFGDPRPDGRGILALPRHHRQRELLAHRQRLGALELFRAKETSCHHTPPCGDISAAIRRCCSAASYCCCKAACCSCWTCCCAGSGGCCCCIIAKARCCCAC